MLYPDNFVPYPSRDITNTLVFYTETEYNPISNQYFKSHYQDVCQIFEKEGLQFVYLPGLLEEEPVRYIMGARRSIPSTTEALVNILPYEIIFKTTSPSLVRYSTKDHGFYIAELNLKNPDEFYLHEFLSLNARAWGYEHRKEERELSGDELSRYTENIRESEESCCEIFETRNGFLDAEEEQWDDDYPVGDRENHPIDKEAQNEINRIEKVNQRMISRIEGLLGQLESRGLKREMILRMLVPQMTVSKIVIGKGTITLPDLTIDDKEIKLAALDFAFYVLYLRHPEGIAFKDVAGHKDELLHIYRAVQQNRSREVQEKTITNFIDPTKNLMSISSSRIRSAFKTKTYDHLADVYCINGQQGAPRRIKLPNKYIVWEWSI